VPDIDDGLPSVGDGHGRDGRRIHARTENGGSAAHRDVVECQDGGPNRSIDGGSSSGGLCISNPSFEGTPGIDLTTNFDAAPWVACDLEGPDVWNAAQGSSLFLPTLPPTDGATYARFGFPGALGQTTGESASEPLCAPLHPGTAYALKVDLAFFPTQTTSPITFEIWGGSTSCSNGELLWTSPTGAPAWKTYCAMLAPTKETTYLTLRANAASVDSDGIVAADHLVPVARCP
jgi:hypothetical protein